MAKGEIGSAEVGVVVVMVGAWTGLLDEPLASRVSIPPARCQ